MNIRNSVLGVLVVAFAAGMSYTPPASAAISVTTCVQMEDMCMRFFGDDGVFGHACAQLCYDENRRDYPDGHPPGYRG